MSRSTLFAVDVGGSLTRTVLLAGSQKPIHLGTVATRSLGAQAICDSIVKLFQQVDFTKRGKVEGIAVAIGCIVRPDSGIVERSPKFGIHEPIDLASLLQSTTKLPTIVRSELSMAALGETIVGAKYRSNNLVVLTVGTGVGAGVVLGGQLYFGRNGCAGEIGHIPVGQSGGGRMCVCGRRGCIESYAASRSVTSATGAGPWRKPEDALKAASRGNRAAIDAIKKTAKYIGLAAAFCANAFDPETIIFRGSFVRALWPLVSPEIKKEFVRHALMPLTALKLTRLPADAVFMGLGRTWSRSRERSSR